MPSLRRYSTRPLTRSWISGRPTPSPNSPSSKSSAVVVFLTYGLSVRSILEEIGLNERGEKLEKKEDEMKLKLSEAKGLKENTVKLDNQLQNERFRSEKLEKEIKN